MLIPFGSNFFDAAVVWAIGRASSLQIVIIIIIRMLGRRGPVVPISFTGNVQCPRPNCKVPFLADGGCLAITNLVQPSLPWTSGWSSPARRRAYLGTSIGTLEGISSRDTAI